MLEQFKEQHWEEQAITELRHKRDTEEVKQEILTLKASVAAEQKIAIANQTVAQTQANADTKLKEENNVLLKEKAEIEEVLGKLEEQHQEEKTVLELRHKRDTE